MKNPNTKIRNPKQLLSLVKRLMVTMPVSFSVKPSNVTASRYGFRYRNRLPNYEGFTLIELLIVIAIIGVLASLLTVNFISVRQRGRDAQRKSNIRQIQAALELYRSDQSNYLTGNSLPCGSPLSAGGTTYMQNVPCDPLGGSYQYSGTSTTYTLVACLENSQDSDKATSAPAGFTCSSGNYYVVTNP